MRWVCVESVFKVKVEVDGALWKEGPAGDEKASISQSRYTRVVPTDITACRFLHFEREGSF